MSESKIFYRELAVDSAPDGASRKVKISFSSESPVRRFDWRNGEWYDEILGHEAGNVDLARLQALGVALFNHDCNKVVGAVQDAQLDATAHKCSAVISFDTDDFAETIFKKVKRGTLKGISVGYVINSFEEVKNGQKSSCGRFTGPCRIARSWTPLEISVVSVPADMQVGVGRALESVDEAELEEFRRYKEQCRQNAANAVQFERLNKEIEILEMECV